MSENKKKSDVDVKKAITQSAEMLQKVAKPVVAAITAALPWIIKGCSVAWSWYQSLPKNAIKFLTGFVFCFFGGLYPVTFAAIQAAEHGGRKKVTEALSVLSEEALVIIEQSKKDDEKDDDGDGVADVKQIDNKTYVMRKVNLVMTKIDPKKVDEAVATLYRVWLSVVAVLMVQFARTISMALSMSKFIMKPVDRFIAPTISLATPEEYKRWVPIVLGWIVKSFAMSIAWYIQTVISAVTSAMSGSSLIADAFLHFCVARNWTLKGLITEKRDDTYVDEVVMYLFAALGIYFQFSMNFDLPFPFNILMAPVEIVEYYLKWTITNSKAQ
mmetsp:Transcript_11298/g.16599  ORF Transcript_11298/g.16599 Transcript_11298/m.16599 type:complete len:328 (+) Transcript_11298:125-1108(+)|eukprot:CAMPEP_0194212864 /NCGR_PEP_ID=MMETSP0156-20130528/13005_1 /TAXON_ID=33649 /ORGANISM="Thalassionema nitzschioides, Strain L26-B" /LENGTH=327 /DNA_ID=CAMNT_0038940757 /DNA_START=72 /DNA_END=1055 /DNA_ORIENTATION=+